MTPVRLALLEARKAAGISQAKLAELVGVRIATISDLERGKSRRIDLELVDRLAQALGVEPGELLERVRKR